MTERNPHKIEQADIVVPKLSQGETAVIFQRHGKYNRDRGAQDAGSLFTDDAERIKSADEQWFHDVLAEERKTPTYCLFLAILSTLERAPKPRDWPASSGCGSSRHEGARH